jgi:hypothetical protein
MAAALRATQAARYVGEANIVVLIKEIDCRKTYATRLLGAGFVVAGHHIYKPRAQATLLAHAHHLLLCVHRRTARLSRGEEARGQHAGARCVPQRLTQRL